MAVSRRLRYEVLRRDNYACRYCGHSAPDIKLTVDHVTPTALGGQNKPENLVTACADCNAGKAASSPDAPLVADVEADALRWAAAMRRATELQMQNEQLEQDMIRYVDHLWRRWSVDGEHLLRPDDWPVSVRNLINGGLSTQDLEYAIDVSMANNRVPLDRVWRYFCGVCWRRLDDRQEIARQMLAAEEAEGN